MALRIDYANAWHHVFNRACRHGPMFLDEDDMRVFLDLVREIAERFDLHVCAFALMTTHFHLLVHDPSPCLSRAMQVLQSKYARYFNRKYGFDGPLFKGRFGNRVIEDVGYLRYATAYVHLNVPPGTPYTEAPWTSHRCYTGEVETPAWLDKDLVLQLFGEEQTYEEYAELVHQRGDDEPMLPHLLQGRTTSATTPPAAPAKPSGLSIEQAAKVFREVVLVGAEESSGPARWLAAWWLARACDIPQARISAFLGMTTASVSRALGRWSRRCARHPDLEKWARRLEAYRERAAA